MIEKRGEKVDGRCARDNRMAAGAGAGGLGLGQKQSLEYLEHAMLPVPDRGRRI